ncbi:MAG: matrixin family metalloprotease [Limosilactobacillus sp.]|nr:matrixin family metalloprotease [Limosilactobacillus sp.]MCH3922250.1 matrixin family metalloprotease [Limosilactobacillus sp.]MCH3929022.1 matrixin family metalloprotease [Limosilactobacillus sp.]
MVGIRRRLFLPLVYLLLFGGIIWFYQNNALFQQGANVAIHDVQVLTYNGINKLTGKKVTALTSQKDDTQKTSSSDGRWQHANATVYIDLTSPVLRNAAESAISQWNRTGAFTFNEISDKSKADIVISAINDKSDGAAGLTNSSTNAMTGYLVHADVQLNAAYLLDPSYGYSQQRIVNTAEHELGHAIGLQHNNGTSVMQPAGSFYTIQPTDVQAVQKLYSSTPKTNQSSTSQSQQQSNQ